MQAKKIVLGVDGSDGARRATEWVLNFARGIDVEVFAVHGLEYPVMPASPYVIPMDEQGWRADLYDELEGEWCAPLREAHVKYHACVIEGHPADVLRRTAVDEDADMIVVGARGRGTMKELLLGSVSHDLVHRSETAVVVVPPQRTRVGYETR